jgi:hypothetical protein
MIGETTIPESIPDRYDEPVIDMVLSYTGKTVALNRTDDMKGKLAPR